MNYEILRYRPEFRPGVVALQRHLVSEDSDLNDRYFRWKHETNPYVREPLVYVALSDGKVAGMRAFQGARWQLGEGDATAFWPCACDFVVDPVHRGNKLFRQIMDLALADLAEEGIGPILNWSASPITYGASLRTGWRLVGPYAASTRHTARATNVRRWAERLRRLPLAWRIANLPISLCLRPGFNALDAAWSRSDPNGKVTIAAQPRLNSMGDLTLRTATPRVRHVRDATYYRWRFGNPLSEYRFVFFDESELQGFLVLRVARLGDGADVSIVDWAATRPEIFGSLLARVVEIGGYDSLSIWSATLDAPGLECLKKLGLEPDDQTRGLPDYRPGLLAIGPRGSDVSKADPRAAANLAGFDRWDLRPLYSDFY
jgi:GNAT superfamily N-acetyltransferase